MSTPENDWDQDGYAQIDGDCDDCNPTANPAAIEVPTGLNGTRAVPLDEDCDGLIDEPVTTCDDGIALDDTDPLNGARAIELCQQVGTDGTPWGVLSARYTRASGITATPSAEVGIMPAFGPHVAARSGKNMLVLSTGRARAVGQPDAAQTDSYAGWGQGVAPPGFPQDVPGCGGDKSIYDDVALELSLKAPSNAVGYSFEFSFYSFEHPEYVCTSFNDQFIALVQPAPPGSIDGNVSFDNHGSPVSVNIAMFDVCDRTLIDQYAMHCKPANRPAPPNPYCPLGTHQLVGTGFNGEWPVNNPQKNHGGATGWLVTTVPVTGGQEFIIRFTIWDTGDQSLDSTVIIDNFKWIAASDESVDAGTKPVPVPK